MKKIKTRKGSSQPQAKDGNLHDRLLVNRGIGPVLQCFPLTSRTNVHLLRPLAHNFRRRLQNASIP
ncbi:hypothetical protein KIN20_038130 [Parelaphostrongylus tenuis]|uniref:Uncharacterized protein n=1 Tax=Parelaphostrongylus tenuis TaxID=148309 RepID=A0AAD5RF23_PARTN|nr:hypothetical protein KIN20_038130 [Parelaphostrongylus tenuis]